MLLLEADGKRLLREAGMAVPEGIVLRDVADAGTLPGSGPWIAKAQVPVGGRGKAGGVRRVDRVDELGAVLGAMLGSHIKGCAVREVLVEEVSAGAEHYLAVLVDAEAGALRLLYSSHGGMDVESRGFGDGHGVSIAFAPEPAALDEAIAGLLTSVPAERRDGLRTAATQLGRLVLQRQLLLAEVNPLFAVDARRWVAGDAKVVIDMNAVPGQPALRTLLEERRDAYPDAWRKVSEDFDFVEIDEGGEIGLVTTGAGLSMMLIDELVARGLKPYNFCDMRTGQMRGSPARLLRIFDWLAAARDVRVLIVNIFAGITDLAEFAKLLVDALRARPGFRPPVVARLIGNGEAAARAIVEANPDLLIRWEPDLERAIAAAADALRGAAKESRHAA